VTPEPISPEPFRKRRVVSRAGAPILSGTVSPFVPLVVASLASSHQTLDSTRLTKVAGGRRLLGGMTWTDCTRSLAQRPIWNFPGKNMRWRKTWPSKPLGSGGQVTHSRKPSLGSGGTGKGFAGIRILRRLSSGPRSIAPWIFCASEDGTSMKTSMTATKHRQVQANPPCTRS